MEQNGPLRFGPYVVQEQIGSGGMGAVYRARDTRLERDVAVKVLHRHLEMTGARERFLREARAVSSLSHPNISTIFDIGDQNGDPYLVMELLHGVSLKEYLESAQPLSQPQLISIAMQAAMALAAAHAKGIVHRDIKPANLFLVGDLTAEPQLKVLDFGLAKIETDRLLYGDSGGLTRTGATVGTVEYMSPEQARGEDLDPRSDLFSLGAVLYELATGDVPFRGATSAVVFAELLGSDPVPPRKANPRVTAGLDSVIRRLLEKKRENRMPSANALLEELRKLKDAGSRTAAAVPAVPSPRPAESSAPPASLHSSANDPSARAIRGRDPSGVVPSLLKKTSSGDRASAVANAVREPSRKAISTEVATASGADRELPAEPKRSRWWIPALAVLVVGVGAGMYALRSSGSGGAAASVVSRGLQITQFDNTTGNAILKDLPAVGLQILLRELPTLHVTGYAPTTDAADIDAAELARRSDADVYLTGNVSRDADRYHVHAELVRTADGSRLASEDVDAGSALQIPDALSRLAIQLRTHLGETPAQAAADTIGLDTEASASLNALAAYAHGTALLREGQVVPSIEQFKRALADDAGFATARLDLIEALRESGAEIERRQAAAALRGLAGKGSVCQRARIAYELAEGTVSLTPAQAWTTTCALQPAAQIALARASLANGRNGEAEAAGNRAADLDPTGRAAMMVATESMIAQAHYESASKQQAKAATVNAGSPGLALLAADLRGDEGAVVAARDAAQAANGFWDQWYYVTYLSSRGRLAEARTFGEAAAGRMAAQPSIASSAGLLRARLAAMDALAGHCDRVEPYTAIEGESARFFADMAAAWCRKPANSNAPVDPTLSAAVRAAAAWSHGDAAGTLNALQGAKESDQSPVVSLLRGEAHLALSQQVLAISDFKAVIARRGAALLTGTLAYPAAQAGLATAYRTMGDTPNAGRAAADLKSTWSDAARSEPLLNAGTK